VRLLQRRPATRTRQVPRPCAPVRRPSRLRKGEVDHWHALIEKLRGYDGPPGRSSAYDPGGTPTTRTTLDHACAAAPVHVCRSTARGGAGPRVGEAHRHRLWEPVIVVSARKPEGVRDWIQVEPDSYQWRAKPASYVIGQKPKPFCMWLFAWLGAEPDDTSTTCSQGRATSPRRGRSGSSSRRSG
jgi:hypothetical protein